MICVSSHQRKAAEQAAENARLEAEREAERQRVDAERQAAAAAELERVRAEAEAVRQAAEAAALAQQVSRSLFNLSLCILGICSSHFTGHFILFSSKSKTLQ